MCGICGIFNFSQEIKVDTQQLRAMLKSISHRGPDDEGLFTEGNFGFGNCRLSIIDVKGGHQPIFNEDKSLGIVFNGEIYNFLDLRRDLEQKGHKFLTKTDTEVILHLYEEEQEKCLEKLDGMFALAIWDGRKKELFLARDPLGKKPLYWVKYGNKFAFGSEAKAILTLPDFKKKIDKDALSKYFFYGYVPSPNTIFEGVKRLSAGSYMVVDQKGIKEEKKFWEIDYSQKIEDLGKEEVKKEVIKLLKSAVEKRLVADVPVGVFLSGGIDSSLIAAFIAAFVPNKKIEAFTIGFEDSRTDESKCARMTAEHLGIKQNLKIFSDKEVFSLLPKALALMDEPLADPSVLPTYLLSAFTARKVKVVLSGDGGDESFAGYPKYLAHWILNKTGLERFPISFPAGRRLGKIGQFLAYAGYPLEIRNQLWLSSLSLDEIRQLTGREVNFGDIEKYHRSFNGRDSLDEAFFLDQKLTLADQCLVKVDRASMANGLEVRCPFLDKELVQFAAMIPSNMKIKNFKTKSLLRRIAEDFLPREIINQPKKGFGVPLKKWLNEELISLKNKSLSLEKIRREGVLDVDVVSEILKKNNPDSVWKLLVFEVWADRWLK